MTLPTLPTIDDIKCCEIWHSEEQRKYWRYFEAFEGGGGSGWARMGCCGSFSGCAVVEAVLFCPWCGAKLPEEKKG